MTQIEKLKKLIEIDKKHLIKEDNMRDGKFLKQMEERIIPVPEGSNPVFIREEVVPIPVSRLERFIEAEVRLDILKKHLDAEPDFDYTNKSEIRRILGMEVLSNGNKGGV